MFILNWLRDYYRIKNEFPKQEKICESCETLKMQLSIANNEKQMLLNRLLERPTEEPKVDTSDLKPIGIGNRHVPWRIKQQHLEAESRAAAQLLKQNERESAVKPTPTEELEKEVVGES